MLTEVRASTLHYSSQETILTRQRMRTTRKSKFLRRTLTTVHPFLSANAYSSQSKTDQPTLTTVHPKSISQRLQQFNPILSANAYHSSSKSCQRTLTTILPRPISQHLQQSIKIQSANAYDQEIRIPSANREWKPINQDKGTSAIFQGISKSCQQTVSRGCPNWKSQSFWEKITIPSANGYKRTSKSYQ